MIKRIYTEPQLNELCKEFQPILRLQDWDISVQFVDQDTMKHANGRCEYSTGYKSALIKIPSPETYDTDQTPFPQQDMRHALLHELMHLHFSIVDAHIPENSVDQQLYEQGINAIASVLSELLPERRCFLCFKGVFTDNIGFTLDDGHICSECIQTDAAKPYLEKEATDGTQEVNDNRSET